MSLRPRRKNEAEAQAEAVRTNLAQLKETWVAGETTATATAAPAAGNVGIEAPAPADASALRYDELTEKEKSAASLGVNPSELRPIAFMNEGHFEALKKANALDSTLARRIEAYRVVAQEDKVAK